MKASSKNSGAAETDSSHVGIRSKLPPLNALLAFGAASRHGNFGLAAQELGVTPSAISHQIQKLEDFLGVQLFIRHAGRAVLTKAGQTYASEIAQAFAIITNATRLVAPQSQRGHLVIASGPSFAAKWLQPRIPQFIKDHPEIGIRLSTLSDLKDLESSRFDVAISYGCPPATRGQVEPLLVERLRPLCCPELADQLQLQTPKDLAKATLIHSINALTWSEYMRRFGAPNLKPRHELWFDRSTMAIDAAVKGLGIVLESEILAAEELKNGALIAPFDDPKFEVETISYYLVRSADSKGRSHVGAFEAWLRTEIALANLGAANKN
jgi:LysR family transcriptional regulator, glycine cleavage system transcriptional activator